MERYRKSIEAWFETLTRIIYRERIKTILFVVILLMAFISNLPKLTMDTSTEGFLHDDDPAITAYNEFRDQFGRDELIVVAINPPNVFDLKFLEKLKALHLEIEDSVPHIDDVTSMINSRNTRGEGDQLIVEDLLETFPKNREEMAELKKRVLSNPLYRNSMVSEDGKFTTIVIKTNSYSSVGESADSLGGFEDEPEVSPSTEKLYLTDQENNEVVEAVKLVTSKYNSKDFPITIAGSPVVTSVLKTTMKSDMQMFMKLLLLSVAVILLLIFRRASGVFIPLLIITISLLSTLGLMADLGIQVKLPTQILPSFIIAVGVGDAIHILALFYRKYNHYGDKEEAIVYALGHSALPVLMTSLTTAIGLASFSTAELAPVADLGMMASIGVMLAFVYTVLLIPALVSLFPLKRRELVHEEESHGKMERLLKATADFSVTYPKSIVTAGMAIILVGLFFTMQLKFSHNPLAWMPETMKVRQATMLIDDKLRGSSVLEVVIDTKKENGIYNPELLNRLEELKVSMEGIKDGELFVGKTITISDMLKEINKALNENRDDYYRVPQDPNLIAQEFLLFENSGSDDLEDMVDSQFSKARFTIKTPWLDAMIYGKFIKEVEGQFKSALGGVAEVTTTGMIAIFGKTIAATIVSMAKSYVMAFVMIALMMILLIGNIRIGLISMIPNLMPIIVAMGIMKVAGFPLDMFTMLIGSIAIGLAVDDTVHFMYNFKKYYHDTGDVQEAVRHTLHTAGKAMLVTSIVLTTGFLIFMFSEMKNLFNFGLLTGITIITALLADFLMTPAIMKLLTDKGLGFKYENGSTKGV